MDAKVQQQDDGKPHGDFGSAGAGPMATILADPITCLICLPRYSIRKSNVTMKGRTVTYVGDSSSVGTQQIGGLNSWQMGMSFFHALGVIDPPSYRDTPDGDQGLIRGNDPFERLLLATDSAASNFGTLYDAETLGTASRKNFQRLSAQVALLNFMSLANETDVKVRYEASEPRFCMAPGIFYAIEALLCILAMFSLLLAYFVRKHGVPPRNPFTLQDLNDIIEISPKLASLLHVTGHNSLKDLGMKLARTSYGLTDTRDRLKESFAIDTYPDQTVRVPPANEVPLRSRAESKLWIPFAMRPVGCVLLCLLPVALSTTLIALLIRSDKSKGVVNLPDTILAHYGWTLLPTSIFLAVLAFDGTLNTAIQILQPFHNLQDGRTEQDSNTYTKDFGGMIPIRAFVYALRHGYVAMMATTFTTLCAPFFPIVINGLFRYAFSIYPPVLID